MIRIRLPGFAWRRLLAPDFGDRDPSVIMVILYHHDYHDVKLYFQLFCIFENLFFGGFSATGGLMKQIETHSVARQLPEAKNISFLNETLARILEKCLFPKVHILIRGRSRSCLVGQIWRPVDTGQSYVSRGFFDEIRNYAESLLNKSLLKAASFLWFRRPAKPQPVYASRGRILTAMMILIITPTRHYYFNVGKVNTAQRLRGIGKALSMPGSPLLECNLMI